jgi:hypothetical protein
MPGKSSTRTRETKIKVASSKDLPKSIRAKNYDALIDLMLSKGGDVAEDLAEESDVLDTRSEKQKFVRTLIQRAEKKMNTKEFNDFAKNVVQTGYDSGVLPNISEQLVAAANLRYAQGKIPKATMAGLLRIATGTRSGDIEMK